MSVAGTVTWSQKLPYASKWVVIQDYVISFYICIVFQFHKLIFNSTLYVLLVNWGENTGIFRLPLIVITPQIWHLNTKKTLYHRWYHIWYQKRCRTPRPRQSICLNHSSQRVFYIVIFSLLLNWQLQTEIKFFLGSSCKTIPTLLRL